MSTQATLSIGGMTCSNCSGAIEKLLLSLKGVDQALRIYLNFIFFNTSNLIHIHLSTLSTAMSH